MKRRSEGDVVEGSDDDTATTTTTIHREQSNPVDATSLSSALSAFADSKVPVSMPHAPRTNGEKTPISSPRKRQRVYGDRYMPTREGLDLHTAFKLLPDEYSPLTPSKSRTRVVADMNAQKADEANRTFTRLLHSELFDTSVPHPTPPTHSPESSTRVGSAQRESARASTPPARASSSAFANTMPAAATESRSYTPSTPSRNLLSYASPRNLSGQPTPSKTPRTSRSIINMDPNSEFYNTNTLRTESQKILLSPKKPPRHISKVPYKVLDAPELADDFYLNLVDWGANNMLGVGLGHSVYMWNSLSGTVDKLCELPDDQITSVNFVAGGSHAAIGTNKGEVQIWDITKGVRSRTMLGHTSRVGALASKDHVLTSGSRDRTIYHRDLRKPQPYFAKLVGHKQEVCGLKWNPIDDQLASGGNDNKLLIWDKYNDTPTWKLSSHTAAVKAIAWSPHQHHLLASGGGTADRKIKFWNTSTGTLINEIDTGSQVCNLAWSKNTNEVVSTHGYSQNQITVWKYPSMNQVAFLTGHTFRVLYLALSPDGQTVVTGAGDETLRFWKCFNKKEGGHLGGSGGLDDDDVGIGRYSIIR